MDEIPTFLRDPAGEMPHFFAQEILSLIKKTDVFETTKNLYDDPKFALLIDFTRKEGVYGRLKLTLPNPYFHTEFWLHDDDMDYLLKYLTDILIFMENNIRWHNKWKKQKEFEKLAAKK